MRTGAACCLSLFLAMSLPAGACPFAEADGAIRLKIPVDGLLISGFGLRRHPILQIAKMHTGTDWSAEPGAPVRASAGGTVVTAGLEGGYGNMVVIRHREGIETAYAHLDRIDVKAGDCVERDTVVGGVGSTGLTSGPALHFEVRRHGVHVDPLATIAETDDGKERQ